MSYKRFLWPFKIYHIPIKPCILQGQRYEPCSGKRGLIASQWFMTSSKSSHDCGSIKPVLYIDWLTVLEFNTTLTARVTSWSVTGFLTPVLAQLFFKSHGLYFSYILQRWKAKIRQKESLPQPGIELTTTRSWVRHVHTEVPREEVSMSCSNRLNHVVTRSFDMLRGTAWLGGKV